jgi:hypothetical protein
LFCVYVMEEEEEEEEEHVERASLRESITQVTN